MEEEKIISILKLLNKKENTIKKINNKLDHYTITDEKDLAVLAFNLKKELLINNKNYQIAIGLIWMWESWMGNFYNLKERIKKLHKWWEDNPVYEDGLGWGWGEIYKWWSNNFNPERIIIVYMLSKRI